GSQALGWPLEPPSSSSSSLGAEQGCAHTLPVPCGAPDVPCPEPCRDKNRDVPCPEPCRDKNRDVPCPEPCRDKNRDVPCPEPCRDKNRDVPCPEPCRDKNRDVPCPEPCRDKNRDVPCPEPCRDKNRDVPCPEPCRDKNRDVPCPEPCRDRDVLCPLHGASSPGHLTGPGAGLCSHPSCCSTESCPVFPFSLPGERPQHSPFQQASPCREHQFHLDT
uniref:Uncharacterized protein n=1 Tax=Ficedula albicollis TaxID=59894 RepID=A0A803W9N5_FICAL